MLTSAQYQYLASKIVSREQYYRTIEAGEPFPEMPRLMECLAICNEMYYRARNVETPISNGIDPGRLLTFETTYHQALTDAVTQYPAEYPWFSEDTIIRPNDGPVIRWPRKSVQDVADAMIAAVVAGSFNKDGRAFRATCKHLGIKHTYQAIRSYIAGL